MYGAEGGGGLTLEAMKAAATLCRLKGVWVLVCGMRHASRRQREDSVVRCGEREGGVREGGVVRERGWV